MQTTLSVPLISIGARNAELGAEVPGVLTRCGKVIAGIKKAVAAMRVEAEAANCYREKCSVVLATAIGASLALDQVTRLSAIHVSYKPTLAAPTQSCCQGVGVS